MKSQLLFFFLVALFLSLKSNADMLLDTNGNVVVTGTEYYIIPVSHGLGGGLTATQHNYEMCPLYVAQENMDLKKGQPLTFHPWNSKDNFVTLSGNTKIVFAIATTCMQGTGWQMGNVEKADHRRHVILNSTGNAASETGNDWFKIDKSGDDGYKIVFCPSVCKTETCKCGDVGVFNEDGKKLLGLGGQPLHVQFERVDSGN